MFSQDGQAVPLDRIRRHPVSRRATRFDLLGVGHVVAEPLTVAPGVSWTHPAPMPVEDEALQQAC
jgi:hypothetical protein